MNILVHTHTYIRDECPPVTHCPCAAHILDFTETDLLQRNLNLTFVYGTQMHADKE